MMGGGYKEPPKFLYRQELRHSGDGISESGVEFINPLNDNQYDYLRAVSLSDDGTRLYAYALDDDPIKNHGAIYEFAREGSTWSEIGKITCSLGDNTVGVQFGMPSQRVGDYLFAGVPLYDQNGFTDAGAVFVFHSSSAGWQEVQKLTGSGFAGDNKTKKFGAAVMVNDAGTIMVVGSPEEQGDPASNQSGNNQGAAYVFVSSSAGWVEAERLQHWGPTYLHQTLRDNDYFGTAITMNSDGTKIAVSAPRANTPGVWIFESGSNGYQESDGNGGFTYAEAVLLPAGSVTGGKFGTSIAMTGDGERLVVGAPSDSTTGANNGAIRVFDKTESGFVLVQSLFENTVSRALGTYVSIHKKVTGGSVYHLLVGGIGSGGSGKPHYVYQDFGLGNGFEKYQEIFPEGNNQWSGPCMSKDGKQLAIGMPYKADRDGGLTYDPVAGAIATYEWTDEY